MDINILDQVFKAYDIRGRYPEQLNSEFFTNLGKAYVTHFKPKKVVVGNDIRNESVEFKEALIGGLLEMGCDVVDIGEVATEVIYFAAGEYQEEFDGGLVVTASHNPAGWNGCKMVGKGATAIGKDSGMQEMKKIIIDGTYNPVRNFSGEFETRNVYPEFKEKVLSFITSEKRHKLKIAVDAGNGIGGKVFDYVFGDLDIELKPMFFEPDGTFPNHVPNPILEENVADLRNEVMSGGYDMGIAIDGDADRVFFIDRLGRRPDGVFTGLLIFEDLVRNSSNRKLIHDPRSLFPYKKEAERLEAQAIQCPSGHSNFKQKMADENALFGAEMSSHFFYHDFYNADSGMVSIAVMLNMLYNSFDLTMQLDRLFDTYYKSGEVNYHIENAAEKIKEIEATYEAEGAQIEKIDGISVNFSDWRFNLRMSNTEPVLRLNLESLDKGIVIEKFFEVEKLIDAPRENTPALEELKTSI